MSQPKTEQDWFAWADAAAVRLAERAAEAEALRSVPEASIREAAEAGFFHLLAPKTNGGAGATMTTFLNVGRRMARGCPSTAWTLSFLAEHAWLVSRFEPALQDELFVGGAMPMIPAPLAPTGKAEAVEGGYRISGRWEWATGVNHSDWVMVSALEGMMPRFCVLPLADVEVEDVWKVSGMAATGSNTLVARDVFVPAHRTLSALQLRYGPMPGLERHPDSTVGWAMPPLLALVAAGPALGAAEGALAVFSERMRSKIQAHTGGARAVDNPFTHLRLGEAMATVRAAALVWEDAVALYERDGPLGGAMSTDSLAAVRLASAHTVKLACEAIDIMCRAAGASAGFLSSPLQRHLRDVQMIRGHVVFDWDRAAALGGKIALGFDPAPADLL